MGSGPTYSDSPSGGVASSIASSPTDTLRASRKPFILVHVVFRCKNTRNNDAGFRSANSRNFGDVMNRVSAFLPNSGKNMPIILVFLLFLPPQNRL